jgi:hypothetical protein
MTIDEIMKKINERYRSQEGKMFVPIINKLNYYLLVAFNYVS